MTVNSPSEPDDLHDGVTVLLKHVLPIAKRRECLTALADFWKRRLHTSECLVLCELPQQAEFSGVSCVENEPPDYRLFRLSGVNSESAGNELLFACRETFSAQVEHIHLLRRSRGVIGAILWNSDQTPAPELIATTGLLLEQLEQVELARPNGIGVDWLNRRKQDALIEFAAGAGHEINNPVAAISGRVQLLLKDEDDPRRRESLSTIGAQALRISQMIGDTMQFAEPPPLHPARCELGASVKTILEKLGSRLQEQGTQVKLTRPDEVWIAADENQLLTVVAELVTNSLNALGQGGTVNITVAKPDAPVPGFAKLEVSDDGPGLTELDRRHLFDPFYSGRQAGRGLGFGLCKCWRIVTGHGGTVEVNSVPWVQTSVTTLWPVG